MIKWSVWQKMPSPSLCRSINGPGGPGVYQVRNSSTGELILFGIGKKCQKRMKSLFPKPYGVGTRNNKEKRAYVLHYWHQLEYRTYTTMTRERAKTIEDQIKSVKNHKYNT